MKLAVSLIVLHYVIQIVLSSSADLYSSMDDAGSAIMSFYDPMYAAPEVKLKSVVAVSSVASVSDLKKSPPIAIKKKPALPKHKYHNLYIAQSPDSAVFPISLETKPTKRISLNKFAEAIEDIEKALAEAQLIAHVKHDERRLSKLRDLIKTAVQKRSYRFARKAIGEAMFTIKKINEQRKSVRAKRSIVLSSKNFLGSVKKKIGETAFNDLLAMQGQVTLMFAIDDTGSMRDEIAAAKRIAKSIVDQDRVEPVDYILLPFNDPGTGPLTYCDENEKNKFVNAIDSLKPHGGGDCNELTFKGMSDAIDEGPQPDSPLYVFTDAGPKDANEENRFYLQELAQAEGIVINFFVFQGTSCVKTADISLFQEVARETMGQVFTLKDPNELDKLKGLTATSLGGTAVMASGIGNKSRRKKRSTSKNSKVYPIPVDDSVGTLVISVTADQPSLSGSKWRVSLTSPSGSIAGVGTEVNKLDRGTVFQISNPKVGIWTLKVEADSNVNYDFFVKGSSTDNIDFEFYFVRTTVRRGISITAPIISPVLHREAEAILTLGGVSHVDQRTLKAELITLEGDKIHTSKPVSLTSKDKTGIRHSFKFFPPKQVFKIKLKGKTKAGNAFERICHKPIKPESLLVKVTSARNDNTVAQGSTGYVIFTIENFGKTEVVDIKSFANMGTIEKLSRKFARIRKGRRSSFSVKFRAVAKVTKGDTVTIVVFVKGRDSGSQAVTSVATMVV